MNGYKPAKLDAGSRKKKPDPAYIFRIVWAEEIAPRLFETFRKTFDLNRDFPDVQERILAGNLLCNLLNEALKNGWRFTKTGEENNTDPYRNNNLADQLNLNASAKGAAANSIRTAQSYKSSVNLFCEWMAANKLKALTIQELTPVHVQKWVDSMVHKKLAAKTINNHISMTGGIFQRIRKLYRLDHNPFWEVDRLKETESMKYEYLTEDELTRISAHLKKECPALRLILMHLYYGFMRPESVIHLRRKHYDFDNRTIDVIPDNHKNRKRSFKQILEPLYQALLDYGALKLSPETLLFSTGLKPGETIISRNRVSDAWKKYVWHGLGIHKYMYAAKATGMDDYAVQAEGKENLRWLMNQAGHSSLAESQAYLNKRKIVKIDEEKINMKKL